ncbi:FadD3 family acyl-CoA ligase [Aliiglaciecola lipolytica]|uniref:Fatty-acyl-CoA synthase n=1 Tax=Aliiglaciecola lipolytica E3 TaxID=1127673 RepID=K6X004_9ALTE|nr:FadD3 family acyl-CoA ligase [Aliiglaciecola lipolytica]GAC14004.1 fatty-acyl-CoA synthase [Aliiglaciecola lipolytica E3]
MSTSQHASLLFNSDTQIDSVPRLVFAAAAKYENLTAIEDGNTHISYKELPTACLTVSRALISRGIQPGDRIAIWGSNSARWVLAAIGLQMAGAVLVPINTRMKAIEAADIIKRSGAKLVFSVGDFLHKDYPAELAKLFEPSQLSIVTLTERKGDALQSCSDWSDFTASAQHVSEDLALKLATSIDGEQLSDLMFTSGTTGKPKGVMSRHGAMIRAFTVFINTLGIVPGDRYLIVNPFFHSFGYKAGWVACLLAGATILPQAVFDADEVFSRISDDKITVLPGPPTLYLSLLAHPSLETADLSSLRVAVTGASTIPPILIEQMRNQLGFDVVTTAYGLTECGGLASICAIDTDVETIANTSGCAIEGTEIAIISAQGEFLEHGKTGEICIRGFHVMKGYFEQAQATAEAIDSDGWLHTGDVGHLDENGYLSITDRLKDMYISGGFNCYPAEIEAVLVENPAIAQSAVVGIKDERMGEVGCAFITLKHNHNIDEASLIAWCKDRMANYRVPRKVRIIDAMPLNASNKIVKAELIKLV